MSIPLISYRVTQLLCLLPVILGVVGTVLPSFGYFPVAGFHNLNIDYYIILWQEPGFSTMVVATLISGCLATSIALLLTVTIFSVFYSTSYWKIWHSLLSPMLAFPHAAFALGMMFLVTPSGWYARFLASFTQELTSPPTWHTVHDAYGVTLGIALGLKELPFLILMTLSACNQVNISQLLKVGQSLGYHPVYVWLKIIWPQLLPQMRLPIIAVIAYSFSVVDIAQILGPTTPPTMAVAIMQWFGSEQLEHRLLGSAGAICLLLLTGLLMLGWLVLERLLIGKDSQWLTNGLRHRLRLGWQWLGHVSQWIVWGVWVTAIISIVLWAVSWRWRYPDILPSEYSLKIWSRYSDKLLTLLGTTWFLALGSAVIGLLLVLGLLEAKKAQQRYALSWLYLPLLIPQISFIFGFQWLLVSLNLDGTWGGVVWSHLIYVIPYICLALVGYFKHFDKRYLTVAVLLSGRPQYSYWRIKIAMLLRPVLFAIAVGVAVSVAQYLPTLFAGAGRVSTLTTEAVSLAQGADYRVTGVFALALLVVPLATYGCAFLIPYFIYRRFSMMRI
ncbi:ABC transporter permease [Zooshikella sp. RANM57]|uniref:ABC transporter permease n=1 Tax=Zooshikella sp. RANM57 TaxID=3425863 RepID=UPI003D6DB1DD